MPEAMIVVGTTFVWPNEVERVDKWLRSADGLTDALFFAAVQTEEEAPRLSDRVTVWTFSIDGWRWSTRDRLIGITTGRNLVREYALRETDCTHVYFADADISYPPDVLDRLLELDHPVVAGHVPSYCLDGPKVDAPGDVREHWNTAGSLLVRRDVVAEVAWRWNPDRGMTDDPCFAEDVERAGFGKTWVRHDVICDHHPEVLVAVEQR